MDKFYAKTKEPKGSPKLFLSGKKIGLLFLEATNHSGLTF